MHLTMERSEVFEDLASGRIHERFAFAGSGVAFDAAGRPLEFAGFTLRVERDPDGQLEAVLLEADSVPPGTLRLLHKAVPLPIPEVELIRQRGANVLLQLRPEVLAQDVLPRLAAVKGVGDLLALVAADGRPVIFTLQHYTLADLALL